jgi:hypothetical protein
LLPFINTAQCLIPLVGIEKFANYLADFVELGYL